MIVGCGDSVTLPGTIGDVKPDPTRRRFRIPRTQVMMWCATHPDLLPRHHARAFHRRSPIVRSMIRLDRIDLREIRLELREPFRTSSGTVAERRILLLIFADGAATETWSECVAESLPTYSPDTVDTSWLALTEWIVPAVLGHSFPAPD